MKKFTLSFLAVVITLSPLPAFAQGSQTSIQKNTNEAVAVVTSKSIHRNTGKFNFIFGARKKGSKCVATALSTSRQIRVGSRARTVSHKHFKRVCRTINV